MKRLRQTWPKVRILLRADSGFCRWKTLRWCDRNDVDFLVDIARNERLNAQAQPFLSAAERALQNTGRKQRRFLVMHYAAQSWDRPRRILVKAEHTAQGSNPRYPVTNLKAEAQYLYDRQPNIADYAVTLEGAVCFAAEKQACRAFTNRLGAFSPWLLLPHRAPDNEIPNSNAIHRHLSPETGMLMQYCVQRALVHADHLAKLPPDDQAWKMVVIRIRQAAAR